MPIYTKLVKKRLIIKCIFKINLVKIRLIFKNFFKIKKNEKIIFLKKET